MRTDVEFASEGETISAHLYLPDGDGGPWPVVVMAGGWCYVKELVQPDYAKEFACEIARHGAARRHARILGFGRQ